MARRRKKKAKVCVRTRKGRKVCGTLVKGGKKRRRKSRRKSRR
jgi:hypothetical protein